MALRFREYSDRLGFVRRKAEELGWNYGKDSPGYNRAIELVQTSFREHVPERIVQEAKRTGTDFELPPEVEESFRELILPLEEKAKAAPSGIAAPAKAFDDYF